MRAEHADRDGLYHSLYRSSTGNGDTLGGQDATDRNEDQERR